MRLVSTNQATQVDPPWCVREGSEGGANPRGIYKKSPIQSRERFFFVSFFCWKARISGLCTKSLKILISWSGSFGKRPWGGAVFPGHISFLSKQTAALLTVPPLPRLNVPWTPTVPTVISRVSPGQPGYSQLHQWVEGMCLFFELQRNRWLRRRPWSSCRSTKLTLCEYLFL